MGNPAHAITVRTYQEFRDDIQVFAQGRYNFTIVIGATGIAKTETVREMLGQGNYLELNGSPSAWRFYQLLYENRNKFVVLDDVTPKFFRDDKTVSMLKHLTNTVPVKTLRWATTSAGVGMEYPSEFVTTSRVIVLANAWDSVDEHIRALEGRAFTMRFDPTPTEVLHEVSRRGWFHDQEVYDYIWEHRRFITQPDMRLFGKLSEQRKAGRPWKKRGLEMIIGNEQLVNVAQLLADPKYTSNRQRMKAFVDLGYGGRTHFYDLLNEFRFYREADPNAAPPQLPHEPPEGLADVTQWLDNWLDDNVRA